MDAAAFETYVRDRYEREITWYDSKAASYKTGYTVLQSGLLGLSAITPVLIALEFLGSWSPLKWVTLAVAVAVALLSTTLKTFKFEENWINYRTTCETLKKEIHFFKAGVDDYAQASDKEALFVRRVEALISRENTLWLIATKRQPDAQ